MATQFPGPSKVGSRSRITGFPGDSAWDPWLGRQISRIAPATASPRAIIVAKPPALSTLRRSAETRIWEATRGSGIGWARADLRSGRVALRIGREQRVERLGGLYAAQFLDSTFVAQEA